MREAIVMILILTACGCGTTTTIHLKDGTSIEGRIKRSDQTSIYVMSEDSSELVEIERGSVKDIDHPGDIHALVGTVLGVLGWTAVIVAGR